MTTDPYAEVDRARRRVGLWGIAFLMVETVPVVTVFAGWSFRVPLQMTVVTCVGGAIVGNRVAVAAFDYRRARRAIPPSVEVRTMTQDHGEHF